MSGGQAQITLQTERADGRFDCEGFSNIPAPQPCWIVLSACGVTRLQPAVQQLRQELVRELLVTVPAIRRTPPAAGCPRVIDSPSRSCNISLTYPQSRKLLVLLGDSSSSISVTPLVQDWLAGRPYYEILPLYPDGVTALPAQLAHLQLFSWKSSIAEVVPVVLAAAGIAPGNFRVFISYKRDDTRVLAEQLFDALSKMHFDVFLDRFRIPPAANFQTRLRQELADKAMVVLLESALAAHSAWIRFEVGYARKHRLGLMALTLPHAPPVSGIRNSMREHVSVDSAGRLRENDLERVCRRVQHEHTRALVRRRYFLQQAAARALLWAGAAPPSYGAGGPLRTGSSVPPRRGYSIWLTPRPAELSDFHGAHAGRQPGERSVLVGPAEALEPARRASLDWLAHQTGIVWADEGRLSQVALRIARGTL